MIVFGCADNRTAEWVKSIETLPRLEGYQYAGIFNMNDTFIAQYCDSHGNQRWMKYNNESKEWYGVKYVTWGCRSAEYAKAPDGG